MKKHVLAALVTAAAVTASPSALADFPERPITLIVPFSAGGSTDKLARDFSRALRKHLGAQARIDIEYVAGSGGTRGAARAARATPDGYTLLFTHVGMATTAALHRHKPPGYDVLEDFEFLGLVSDMPMTLVGRPSLQANTFPELVKWMQANGNKVRIANAGAGSASHLCGLLLMSALKLEFEPMAYKGGGPAIAEVNAGRADLMCDQTANTLPQIQAGKVRAYAVTSRGRLDLPALSKLATLDELGLKGFEVTSWHGLYAPKGIPKAVADQLGEALRDTVRDPDFAKSEREFGAAPVLDSRSTGAAHKKFVESEIARWKPIIEVNRQDVD